MRILYTSIAAESAVRRYHVRGVAGQEHAPVLKALRDIGLGLPGRDVVDDNRYIGDADGGAQQLKGTLLRDPLGDVGPGSRRVGRHDLRAGYVSDEIDHEKTRITASVEPEEPPQQRVRHVVDALIPVPEQRPEIGLRAEVDGDAVRQKPVAVHANAEQLAGRAAVSVGGDDVFRAYRALRPAGEIADDRRDAVRVLLERHAVGAVAQPRAEFLGAGTEYRLKRVLIDEQPHRRAELIDPGVEVREIVRDLTARQRLDVVDSAVRRVLLFRFAADSGFKPRRAQNLKSPKLEVTGPGVDRRPRVPLDRQHVNSVHAQQQCGRQAYQAAAHDQDWHILAGSVIHRNLSHVPSRCCV